MVKTGRPGSPGESKKPGRVGVMQTPTSAPE